MQIKQQLTAKKLTSWLLRIGLAVVFLYAAVSGTLNPREWIGYLPSFAVEHLPAAQLLKFFSIYELALSVWLLSGFYVRYAALLAAVTLLGIVVTNFSLLAISFRDIGLLFAALALAAHSWQEITQP